MPCPLVHGTHALAHLSRCLWRAVYQSLSRATSCQAFLLSRQWRRAGWWSIIRCAARPCGWQRHGAVRVPQRVLWLLEKCETMTPVAHLSLIQARRLALRSLAPELQSRSVPEVVRRLGYVQIDTIAVVERAHHHVL